MPHHTRFKVAIVGCGRVGMTAAYALVLQGVPTELVLHGRELEKVEGEKLDLEHALPFTNPVEITATDNYADLKGTDLVIFAAGASQKPGETRLDLTKKNVAIVEEVIPQIVKSAPDAVILMVANPVDIMTYRAAQIAGWPPGRIFGSGTMLDTARFRFHLSEFLDVNPRSIHTYVLGEHGDSSFPVLAGATVGGQPLTSFPNFSQEKALKAYEMARTAAYMIIQGKGATYYAIGAVVSKIAEAVKQDSRSVLPVSVPLTNYYGQSSVSLSVPCIVGRTGVSQILTTELSPEEQKQLAKSAETVRQFL